MTRRKVHLHGKLAKEFGPEFEFEVATAGEAIRALNANFPERFMAALKDGSYQLIRDDLETGMGLEENHLNGFQLGSGDLHIVPVIAGSAGRGGKGGGGVKAILGVALIGTAIFMSGGTLAAPLSGLSTTFAIGGMNISWGTVAAFGLAMTVAGAAQLLSPKEKPKDETKRDDSFSFAGPINTNEQGNPIPLVYGRVMTGGQVVSSGIDIEDIGTYASSSGSGVPGYGEAWVGGNLTSVFSGTWNEVN